MLDFHFIADGDPAINHCAEDHNYIGGIEFDEFQFWKNCKVLRGDVDYFSDFRITSKEILEALDRIADIGGESKALPGYQLIKILRHAKRVGSELIAYAD